MSLETRVETLEDELKILKNEIERTLLEIQNQVLIHYYPSLRAEDTTPPKDLQPLLESAFTAVDNGAAESPTTRRPEEDAVTALPPKTREVSLTEIQRKPQKGNSAVLTTASAPKPASAAPKVSSKPAKAVASPPRARSAQGADDKIDRALLPVLAKWVNESVEKIGKELTKNMVESSTTAEANSAEVTDLLLQFITLCDEENPPDEIDTRELMEVLLKLDRMMGQVNKLLEQTASVNGEDHGQGNHNDLHDHR